MTDADRQAAAIVAGILARASGDRYVIAGEIIQALRGHGWKPATTPPPPPTWQQPHTPGAPPPPEWHQARAAMGSNPLDHLDSEDVTR